jgi:catalase
MPLSQDEAVNETSDALVKTMRGAFGTPESYRPGQYLCFERFPFAVERGLTAPIAHAKGRLLRGTFTPTSKASTLSCAPHFTSPSTPLLARFSSSTGLPVSL